MKKHAFAAKMVDGKNQVLNQFEGLSHLKRAVISQETSRNLPFFRYAAANFSLFTFPFSFYLLPLTAV